MTPPEFSSSEPCVAQYFLKKIEAPKKQHMIFQANAARAAALPDKIAASTRPRSFAGAAQSPHASTVPHEDALKRGPSESPLPSVEGNPAAHL